MGGVSQILALAKPTLRWGVLATYLHRLGNRSLAQRSGYLAEKLRPSLPPPVAWSRKFRPGPEIPYVPLGPPGQYGRRGPHDARWRVVRNVADSELFAEGEIP
jgi:predicted transcriptional regulator of viral defense system